MGMTPPGHFSPLPGADAAQGPPRAQGPGSSGSGASAAGGNASTGAAGAGNGASAAQGGAGGQPPGQGNYSQGMGGMGFMGFAAPPQSPVRPSSSFPPPILFARLPLSRTHIASHTLTMSF